MMPLILAESGAEVMVKRVGGNDAIRQHLETLGFVPGSFVTVVTEIAGNVIVNVKDSRIAISREMAQKILVG